MKRTTVITIFLSVLALTVIVGTGVSWWTSRAQPAFDPPASVPEGHKAPTREWLRTYYTVLQPLAEDLQNDTGWEPRWSTQMKLDLQRGVKARLFEEMDGQKYFYAEPTRSFAPRPNPLLPAAPAPARP